MAFFEHDFEVGLRDLDKLNLVSNKAILSFLEDIGSYHSDSIHFGLNDMPKTHSSWILLWWKVKIIKRPIYGDKLHIKTWARHAEKFSTYRDFEVYNDKGELIIIATSKWVLIDTNTGKIKLITEDIIEKYSPEDKSVFPDGENLISKVKDPISYLSENIYTVGRSQIDINKHMHNIYYLDLANEALPNDVYENGDFNFFEILYKKQIQLHNTVKCFYTFENNQHKVIIKSLNNKVLHSIITFSNSNKEI